MKTLQRIFGRYVVLCLLLLAAVGGGPALAEDPILCIGRPVGQPFYVRGETIPIEWDCPNFNPSDPDQADITYLSLFWRWDGESTLNWITDRTGDEAAHGSYNGFVAPTDPNERYLRIVARYMPLDSGTPVATETSDRVKIIPPDAAAVWISSPLSKAPPTQTQPPECFDHLVLEGNGFNLALIRWKLGGCEGVTGEDRLEIEFAQDGTTFSPVHTVSPACGVLPWYSWTIPPVNTTQAKLRVKWYVKTSPTVWMQAADFTSVHPFEITTTMVNRPPVADAGSDRSVAGRAVVHLSGTGSSDPDGDPLTYSWALVEGPGMYTSVITLENADKARPFFVTPSVTYKATFSFQLAVSDPTHAPVTDRVDVEVEPDPSDTDGDWVSESSDNCTAVANPDQADGDHDGVGDVCDNCWTVTNASQADADGDRRGDACDLCPNDSDNDADGDGVCGNVDNCPNYANAGQEDWDGDGEGDVCDCNDGFWSHNEIGMDCGAGCGTPCTADICQPVIYQGPSEDKIDVVIIPADDYFDGFHDPEFLNPFYFATRHALDDLMRSYFADPIMGSAENRTKFNVWLDTGSRGDVDLDYDCDSPPCCDWHVEMYGDTFCLGDVNYIIHLDSCRDYSYGAYFSATQGRFGILLHETGHKLFDLGDEYDDMGSNCTTYYSTAEYWSKSNIWRTRGYCEDYTSLDPDQCYRFTQCQGDWYKAQRGPNMMECFCDPDGDGRDDYPWAICEWGPDGQRMVDHVMGQYVGSAIAGASLSGAETASVEPTKMMLGEFHYSGGRVTPADILVGYGTPPEPRLKNKGFQITLRDAGGAILSRFAVQDPRYKEFPADPPGGEWLKEADFSVAMPFFDTLKTLELMDLATSNPLGKFDLGPYLQRFCAEFSDDESCRCDGDLDQDRDVDGPDLGIYGAKYAGKSPIADLNEDQSIDEEDVAIFARKFGREDCPDPTPPNCSDGNLCTRDFFDPVSKTCVHREKRCYDGSPCTQDRCNPQTGGCEYFMKNCSDGDPCTLDSCDPITGQCFYKPVQCDDGNACTSDFCNSQTGQCVHKTVTCNDGNLCTDDLCDPVSGCFHVRKSCDDENPCTIDACDQKTGGCTHVKDSTCQACCGAFGQCSDLPVKLCQELKGTPMGTGTTCAKVQCPK